MCHCQSHTQTEMRTACKVLCSCTVTTMSCQLQPTRRTSIAMNKKHCTHAFNFPFFSSCFAPRRSFVVLFSSPATLLLSIFSSVACRLLIFQVSSPFLSPEFPIFPAVFFSLFHTPSLSSLCSFSLLPSPFPAPFPAPFFVPSRNAMPRLASRATHDRTQSCLHTSSLSELISWRHTITIIAPTSVSQTLA